MSSADPRKSLFLAMGGPGVLLGALTFVAWRCQAPEPTRASKADTQRSTAVQSAPSVTPGPRAGRSPLALSTVAVMRPAPPCERDCEGADTSGFVGVGIAEPVEVTPAIAARYVVVEDEGVHEVPSGPCRVLLGNGQCGDPLRDDEDADGYRSAEDCDDHDRHAHPGANEVACNFVDEDCDGSDVCFPDADGDGVGADVDCDDGDAQRSPDRQEVPCNGIDEDCSGTDVCDADRDGDPSPDDCDDRDVKIRHDAKEIPCDGIDQDCDGVDCCHNDADGDGVECATDCNDHDPSTYPGAPVPDGCYWTDRNCDGQVDGACRLSQ